MGSKKDKGCLQRIWLGWIWLCRVINDFIELLFEHHTRFITRHYRAVIIACIVFTAFCGAGGWRFVALQRNEELFIPQGSEAFNDLDKGGKYFSLKFRVQEFIVKYADNRNIFDNNQIFLKTLELHEKIRKLKDFEATCLKVNNACLYVSSVEVFEWNSSIIIASNTSEKIQSRFNTWLADPQKVLSNGRSASLNFPNILGNYRQENENKTVEFSNAVRFTYYQKYADTTDDGYDTIIDWEDEYISLCGDNVDEFKKDGLELFYFAARTRDDAILSSTVGDLPLFSVAFILMVAFCLFVFLRIKNPVTGHLTVGIIGICVIMIGVGCGFGLAMWIGTDFVAFTGILMFLILGIGMDNMFIIIAALEEVEPEIQGPERLVIAMKHIGGSITMTTSTDLVAFAVSAVSNFPAVHLFCIYAALSIFFAYFMLITLYLAILTWDIKRMENGQRDLCPCCSVEGYNDNPWENTDVAFSKMVLSKWGKILMTTPMKVIVFLSACGLLAAGVYGTTQITQKFEWKKLSPDGSYFRKFSEARDGSFPAGYDVSIIIPPQIDYTDPDVQQQIIDLDIIAQNNSRYESMTLNWMRDYIKWASDPSVKPYFDFYSNLTTFLNMAPNYKADINYDKDGRLIASSRVVFFYENNNDAINQAEGMKTLRRDLKAHSDIPGIFPISIMFIYAEQFAAVLDDTVQNLAICAGTILIITLPYLTHPGITGLVFLGFSSLLFELFGLMAAWDVSLDAIAMIIIIMAIGFSVDYTCHIAHAFMISKKETPELRVIDALETMGTSVLNGGFSTFLGMLITAFSGAEGFRIFFKMVFGIVVLGLLHGLVFLPVLLSIFIRRDLRSDMKEFIDKHDEKERRKSKQRATRNSEDDKLKSQTLSPAHESYHMASNGSAVELRNVKKYNSDEQQNDVGSPNSGYERENEEVSRHYSN